MRLMHKYGLLTFCLCALLGIMPAMAGEEVVYLMTAAARGDLATVQALLASGASPDTKDAEGVTALMYAARKDQIEVLNALLAKGADIQTKDGYGNELL